MFDSLMGTGTLGKDLTTALTTYVLPFLAVLAIVWAIWIGIAFGNAKDEQARSNAKQRLFKAFASLVIVAICYAILKTMG